MRRATERWRLTQFLAGGFEPGARSATAALLAKLEAISDNGGGAIVCARAISLGDRNETSAPPRSIATVSWRSPPLFYTPQPCLVGPCYLLDVVAVDTRTQAVSRAALPSILWLSDLWLTQRDSALMALRPSQAPAELRELDSHGKLLMQCQLGLDPVRNPSSLPILSNGRYAMLTGVGADGHDAALELWELPGYAPATSGWVSPRGGPGLDLKER